MGHLFCICALHTHLHLISITALQRGFYNLHFTNEERLRETEGQAQRLFLVEMGFESRWLDSKVFSLKL